MTSNINKSFVILNHYRFGEKTVRSIAKNMEMKRRYYYRAIKKLKYRDCFDH